MYANWLTGIYSVEDGIFSYWEQHDEIKFLRNIIIDKLGKDHLWDENGEYRFVPKETYEGFTRKETTSGSRVERANESARIKDEARQKEDELRDEKARLVHPFVD